MSTERRHSIFLKLALGSVALLLALNAWMISNNFEITKYFNAIDHFCIVDCTSEYAAETKINKRTPIPREHQRFS